MITQIAFMCFPHRYEAHVLFEIMNRIGFATIRCSDVATALTHLDEVDIVVYLEEVVDDAYVQEVLAEAQLRGKQVVPMQWILANLKG